MYAPRFHNPRNKVMPVSKRRTVGLGFSRNRTLLEAGVFRGHESQPEPRVSKGARKPISALPQQKVMGFGEHEGSPTGVTCDMHACPWRSPPPPAYREGCNGRENSPPSVETFPSLAKVGIGGQKATRRAIFVRQCTPCHQREARFLIYGMNFFLFFLHMLSCAI